MEYRTGDILKARMEKYPFIFHYGIVLVTDGKVQVIDNPPDNKNKYGGSISVTDIDKWLSTRKLVHIQKTNISRRRIIEVMNRDKARPFRLLSFNCEHFISEIKDGSPSSPQVRKWLFDIVTFIVMAIALRKKVMKLNKRFFPIKA